jgi:hypothetical protein
MIRGNQNAFLVADHLLQGPETTLWTAADNYRSRPHSFHREVEKITSIPLAVLQVRQAIEIGHS